MRRGTASTKSRGEINGSPRKPWRQKGTGRARSGSKKSPIWRGGGVVFGPRPRSYDYGLSRKQRRLATRHALLSKMIDGEALIIDSLPVDKPSTAEFRKRFEAAGLNRSYLVVTDGDVGRGSPQRVAFLPQSGIGGSDAGV